LKRPGKKLVVAVAWYRPEQWSRLVEICLDAPALDGSYEGWVRNATQSFDRYTAAGMTLERVDVDVEQLLAWCEAHGRAVDGEARSAYAAHLLKQRLKK